MFEDEAAFNLIESVEAESFKVVDWASGTEYPGSGEISNEWIKKYFQESSKRFVLPMAIRFFNADSIVKK